MECSIQPVDSSVFKSLATSFEGLPSFERAEMSVSLAKSYSDAYVAYCAAVGAVRSSGSVRTPSVVGGAVYRTCGSPCRRLGSPAMTGSGYWSVPSDLSLDASKVNSDGRCYLSMAARGSRTALYRKLGPWPTISRLLSAPSGRLCRDSMDSVSFMRVSDGTWHVAGDISGNPTASGGVSALKMLARVVDDHSEELDVASTRWDGTLLRDLQLEEVPRGGLDVPGLSDKVGGTRVSEGALRFRSGVVKSCVYSVYLGGDRPPLGTVGWRVEVLDSLAGKPGYRFLYPSGPGINLSDRGMMGCADALVLYFGPGTSSSAALVELGLCAHSTRLVVCCDSGALVRQLVLDVCAPRGVRVLSSLGDVVGLLESWRARPPAPTASAFSPVAVPCEPGVGPCKLLWDEAGGVPVVSVYRRNSSSGELTVASYRCTRKLFAGMLYSFCVPGKAGSVSLKRSSGMHLSGSDDEVAGRYVLTCGRSYRFVLSYALSVLSLTFEYRSGSCEFGAGLGCASVGGLDDPPQRCEFGVPADGSYVQMFRPEWFGVAAAALGGSPTLGRVLSFPIHYYVSSEELCELSLYRVGGSWVVGDLGFAVSFSGLAAVFAQRGLEFPVLLPVADPVVGSSIYPCPGPDDVVI